MEEKGWLRSGREGAYYRQGLLSQNSTVGGLNNRRLLPPSSGCQESEVKVLARLFSPKALGSSLSPASLSLWCSWQSSVFSASLVP